MSQLNVGKVVAGVGVELPTLAESNRPTASSGLMFFNSDKNRVCLLYKSDAADDS